MKPFTVLNGIAALLDRPNVDTDQIIPKQFLRKIERTGFGVHLFHDWRYLDDAGTKLNPDFSLNQERYKGASILITRDNFGCGSSREHAPWALEDYGFRAIVAPSYADIFFNNCFKNGMLPVVLKSEEVEELFQSIATNVGAKMVVDLDKQTVTGPTGKLYHFEVDSFRKYCLYNGLDDIGLTLKQESKIGEFEKKQKEVEPWLYAI
ncbi:3-isopropylmalate dehydratase, small subunit [Leptospira kirschneri str. 200803703]|uniref:3-isopropylmalate dehydratase small subunit n=1 Tax=Leptospira kirschneri str. 200802841 TaxID=1193047 RepID=A0A828Y6L4_9LEPT|nr:3-isopropylmalate dehydratase small subunit [Leptospira kirschneri]EMO78378.1 3-isopropylmalate dehydratase, small subunit [Leptospira kirschneri str. 200801925]EKO50959.1 3-isopropylmalate dehydratase, small subunit [Leptospira kirschneri str. 200802841]EKP03551.1 3-isopropylmalate dehydratase, small subunit [Leptospira kirschneri str. 2008720114]EMK16383.1 3-isopropylmalate dehydratase, small subunit [Leptospira kirschneri serovar Bim str. PUO 1247]EMN04434.1 3-isopropylmalate dehydratase